LRRYRNRSRRGRDSLVQQRLVRGSQSNARIDAEFGGEPAPSLLVRGERVGPPAQRVVRAHQMYLHLFVERPGARLLLQQRQYLVGVAELDRRLRVPAEE
jgi:hypothetical protein